MAWNCRVRQGIGVHTYVRRLRWKRGLGRPAGYSAARLGTAAVFLAAGFFAAAFFLGAAAFLAGASRGAAFLTAGAAAFAGALPLRPAAPRGFSVLPLSASSATASSSVT